MNLQATWLVVVVALHAGGCAVCTDTTDCPGADLCIEGACLPPPPPRATVLSPRGPVGETFELALELGFRGGEATVTLERAIDNPGEPCLPFPPVVRRVAGDVDDYVTRVVVFSSLPALGPSFAILARVEVNGTTISSRVTVSGPPVPADVGGLTIRSPVRTDIDVVREPLTIVDVAADAPPYAFVAPTPPSTALATPRIALVPLGDGWRGAVPALRGNHVLWVEADIGGRTRRCGHGLRGGPAEIDDNQLEVLLSSRSLDGDRHFVQVSTRIGDAFCDGRAQSALPCTQSVAAAEGTTGVDAVVVTLDEGLVEVAAIPRIVSGPVEVQLRVSRGERHVALFGPVILQPALGESWIGGRVIVADGEVQAVIEALDPPAPGLPW